MSTFVFIPGAGDVAWSWHLVEDELRARGHDTIAVDLPCDDDSAGLREYTDTVVDAIGDRTDPILVAQSLGGFTAPLVCERVPVDLIVLVAGMIPAPGETFNQWGENTGYAEGRRAAIDRGDPVGDFEDEIATFMHDVPPELAAEALERGRDQSATPLQEPWPGESWPDVPTRYIVCTHDRSFPAEWLRGVVRDRLGIEPDEIATSHCPNLAKPAELADRLAAYIAELDRTD